MKPYKALCVALALCTLCGCRVPSEWLSDWWGDTSTVTEYVDIELDRSAGNATADGSTDGLLGAFGQTVDAAEEDAVQTVDAVQSVGDNCLCYAVLDKDCRTVYRIMQAAAEEMAAGWISLGETYSAADISVAFQALTADRPDIFWLSNTYLMTESAGLFRKESRFAFSCHSNRYETDYLCSAVQRGQMEAQLEEKITALLAATADKTDFETELYFHNWLCRNVTYTTGTVRDYVYSAYGALVNGTAVCEGYAKAMALLCTRAGIPCTLISGNTDEGGHMWNLIYMEDDWYHLDVTWDDSDAETDGYYFFNLTDNDIAADRTPFPLFDTLSDEQLQHGSYNLRTDLCTATGANYFVHENLLITSEDLTPIAARIAQAAAQGETEATFKFEDLIFCTLFNNDLDGYTRSLQRKIYTYDKSVRIQNVAVAERYIGFYW